MALASGSSTFLHKSRTRTRSGIDTSASGRAYAAALAPALMMRTAMLECGCGFAQICIVSIGKIEWKTLSPRWNSWIGNPSTCFSPGGVHERMWNPAWPAQRWLTAITSGFAMVLQTRRSLSSSKRSKPITSGDDVTHHAEKCAWSHSLPQSLMLPTSSTATKVARKNWVRYMGGRTLHARAGRRVQPVRGAHCLGKPSSHGQRAATRDPGSGRRLQSCAASCIPTRQCLRSCERSGKGSGLNRPLYASGKPVATRRCICPNGNSPASLACPSRSGEKNTSLCSCTARNHPV